MESTSHSLLQRVRDPSDAEAWERFVGQYSGLIYNAARQSNLPDDTVRELTQQILTHVFGKLIGGYGIDPKKKFRCWLRTVARHQTLNFIRDKKRHDLVPLLNPESFPAAESDQDVFEENQYRLEMTLQGLRYISPEFKPVNIEAFKMYTLQGIAAKEVAITLQISEVAVRAAVQRIMKRLQAYLKGIVDL